MTEIVNCRSVPLTLISKLASIVVHCDEYLESPHEFDVAALRQLVRDEEVEKFIKDVGPLAPEKRKSKPGPDWTTRKG